MNLLIVISMLIYPGWGFLLKKTIRDHRHENIVRKKIIFFCTLLLISKVSIANLHFQIEGINNDLQRNVQTHLSTLTSNNITYDSHFQSKLNHAVRKGLRALGYYSPTIDFIFKPAKNINHDILIIRITPGNPVKIADVNITLRGEAQLDSSYQHWITKNKPAVGSILNHGDYEKFKNGLSKLALHKGYFDAKFCKSQLEVAPSLYQAYWNIDFNSGQRYHFGQIRFHGAQIREEYLQNLAKVRKGEPYSIESLDELNRRLIAINWFNSVTISTDFIFSKQSKTLPLDTIVTPRSRNILETSVGYTTDLGSRIKITWNKPWLSSRGHSLQAGVILSIPKQSADVIYKIPLLRDPLEQYYLLQGRFMREDFNNTQADSNMLNIARYWSLSNGWQRALNLHWSLDHFAQTAITDSTMLIYPGISINRTRQRGSLMPTWGDSQHYSVDISSTIWGSDIDFIILQAQNVWIRTLAEKHLFVVRSNLGWIKSNNFERTPPLLRFFAGGTRSIRGYKYRSLSQHNNDGKLIGASKLVTGSLEYQYNFVNKWWSAIFIDSGEAINDIKHGSFKIGVGVGLRWKSPVGPMKLDIAAPTANEGKKNVQFYIGLGSEL